MQPFSEVKMRERNLIMRLVVLAALLYSLTNLSTARRELLRQEAETQALRREKQTLLLERQELERRLDAVGDAEEMRRLAWERLHMVMPGETVFYFSDTK